MEYSDADVRFFPLLPLPPHDLGPRSHKSFGDPATHLKMSISAREKLFKATNMTGP